MNKIVFTLERRVKLSVRRLRRQTRDKGVAMRCQIVLLAEKQRSRGSIAESVGCSVSWVNRVLRRFREFGMAGLEDGREDNGQNKIDERYLSMLYGVVDGSPRDYGYARSTWTQELLAKVMEKQSGVKVHRSTMSRALAMIGARLGRARSRRAGTAPGPSRPNSGVCGRSSGCSIRWGPTSWPSTRMRWTST